MNKKKGVIGSIILFLLVTAFTGCDFVLFPEGWRSMTLFSDMGPLTNKVITVTVDNGEKLWVDSLYTSGDYLLAVTRDYPAFVVYDVNSFEKAGEWALDSPPDHDSSVLSFGEDSDGNLYVVPRRGSKYVLGETLEEEDISIDYTDENSETHTVDRIHFCFEYDGRFFVVTENGHVVDIDNKVLIDERFYPDAHFGIEGWYSVTEDTLYVMAAEGVAVDLPPGANIYDAEIFEKAVMKIAGFPLEELGTWRENAGSYWDGAYTFKSEEEVRFNRNYGDYAIPDLEVSFSGEYFGIASYGWGGTKVINIAEETTIFKADGGFNMRSSALSSDGVFLYRPHLMNIYQYKIR